MGQADSGAAPQQGLVSLPQLVVSGVGAPGFGLVRGLRGKG